MDVDIRLLLQCNLHSSIKFNDSDTTGLTAPLLLLSNVLVNKTKQDSEVSCERVGATILFTRRLVLFRLKLKRSSNGARVTIMSLLSERQREELCVIIATLCNHR